MIDHRSYTRNLSTNRFADDLGWRLKRDRIGVLCFSDQALSLCFE